MKYRICSSIVVALILLYCLTLLPRCAQGRIMIISKEDAGKKIEIEVGDVVQLQLTGTPTTGYWWHFQTLDEKYVEIIKAYTKPYTAKGDVPRKMEGEPILGVWQLRAQKAGTTTVAMAYYRSWQDSDTARHRFYVTLHIH